MKPQPEYFSTFFGKPLYDAAIPKDNFFRLLLITINWDAIRNQLMTDVDEKPIEYSLTGRPAYDPVIIFKMLLLQFYHPASDAKLEERANTDLAYRLFLGIPIPGKIPDESTLSRYRTLWGEAKIKQISDEIFLQIQAFGFANVEEGIVGDTTHQYANIQKPTARELIFLSFENMMKSFYNLGEKFTKHFDRQKIIDLKQSTTDWIATYQTKIRNKELTRSERFDLLVKKVTETQNYVQTLLSETYPTNLTSSQEWITFIREQLLLSKILEENVEEEEHHYKQKLGKRKIISRTDPDARSGQKSKNNRFTGYKVSPSMTMDRFFPNVETIPGNEPDAFQGPVFVEEIIKMTGEKPISIGLDLGFNSVQNRQYFHNQGIQPGIEFNRPTNPRNPGKFSSNAFYFELDTMTAECPAGHTSSTYTINKDNETYLFRFPKLICDHCSLRKQCTTSKNGRTVNFSFHTQMLTKDKEFLQTEIYERLRKARWGEESTFGTAKQSHGLIKTRYHGIRKVSFQNRIIYIVLNLKRLIKLLYFPSLSIPPAPPASGASV